MGANNGTGQPLWFFCVECRKRGRRVYTYEATGRVRELTNAQRGTGGSRVAALRFEYRCRSCGHVGWSRHRDVARLWEKLTGKASP